jgi:hypothetical protein
LTPVPDSLRLPERPSSARRTRQAGASILMASVLAAGSLYWWETRSPETPEGQLLVGYERQRNHDMGTLYGPGGRDLMNAIETLGSPGGHAALVIGAGAIGAWICFYRARLAEEDARL